MNFLAPYAQLATNNVSQLMDTLQVTDSHFFDESRFNEAELRKSLNLHDGIALSSSGLGSGSSGFGSGGIGGGGGNRNSGSNSGGTIGGNGGVVLDKKIKAMKQILAAVSYGRDCSSLFADVVKNCATSNLELKKLTYIYLVQYADSNPQLALLSINSFQKDLQDRSQIVRASALRAMSSVKTLEIIQIIISSIKAAIVDSQPYVRKTAVACCTKVYDADSDQFAVLRDLVLKLFNDRSLSVVSSALVTYHQLCVAGCNGGNSSNSNSNSMNANFALLHPYFRRIVMILRGLDSYGQTYGVDVLLRYARLFLPRQKGTPPTGDLLRLIEAFRGLLRSQSHAVVICAASALCYLASDAQPDSATAPCSNTNGTTTTTSITPYDLDSEIELTIPHLIRCIRTSSSPAAHLGDGLMMLYSAIVPIIRAHRRLWRPYIEEFFVASGPSDSVAIKLQKVELLELLVDERNVGLVVRELTNYVRWQHCPPLVARAVRAMGNVALTVESRVVDECLRDMVRMLDSNCEHQASEAVVALRTLLQQTASKGDDSTSRTQTEGSSTVGTAAAANITSPQDLSLSNQQNLATKEKLGLRNSKFWLQVVSQLILSLEDLTSPVARASVIWIIAEYRDQVPEHSPDAVRTLAKSFSKEATEVKSQALSLAFKIWAFHYFKQNKSTEQDIHTKSTDTENVDSTLNHGQGKRKALTKDFATRLGGLLEYMCRLSLQDDDWDLRDLGRLTLQMMNDAKKCKSEEEANAELEGSHKFAGIYAGLFAKVPSSKALEKTLDEITTLRKQKGGSTNSTNNQNGANRKSSSANQTLNGYNSTVGPAGDNSNTNNSNLSSASELPYKDKNSWILYSLARILDGSFGEGKTSYHALPSKAIVDQPCDDKIRDPPEESVRMIEKRNLPQSFSSDTKRIGGTQRVIQPSMIDQKAVPQINTIDDLDSFYNNTEKTIVKAAEVTLQQQQARAKQMQQHGGQNNGGRGSG